jgi:hypothetical protein
MDDSALADLVADRARLQLEVGDPKQVRSERDGIENVLEELRREHHQLRGVLAEGMIDRQPEWLIDALGQRPAAARGGETWDRAARAIARFRLDNDVIDRDRPLGPEPPGSSDHRREWDRANTALEHGQRQLGREPSTRDRGVDLGIG